METYQHYDIDTKYLGITYDETRAVEILDQQFITCQQANRQFAALTLLSNHLPTHPHVLQLSMPRTKQGLRKDVLYRSGIWTVPPSQHQ